MIINEDHHDNKDIFGSTLAQHFSLNRFELLMKFLQISYRYRISINLIIFCKYEKKRSRNIQIRNFRDFEIKIRDKYIPSGVVAFEESIIHFKGRFKYKVYFPNKPDKWGGETI